MDRNDIEREIIDREWDMFGQVQGIDGRAECQDERETFIIMRLSQFKSWPMEVNASYLLDLESAIEQERNLVMEKYAYMMEETDPVYFEGIKPLLPQITDEVRITADKITGYYLIWEKELAIHYPNVRKHGRPVEEISLDGTTSFGNYLRCELYTYSQTTLNLLLHVIESNPENNLYKYSMEMMVHAYGYTSLQDAEDQLAKIG